MKKVLGIVVIGFVLFFLLSQPANAATVVRGAGGVVQEAFNSFISFLDALFK
ncbi:MAG: hypothetical protein ACRDPI_05565 [Nocardioidaceae bacterium]